MFGGNHVFFLVVAAGSSRKISVSLPLRRQGLHVIPPEVDLDIQLEKNLRAQLKVPCHEMGLVRAGKKRNTGPPTPPSRVAPRRRRAKRQSKASATALHRRAIKPPRPRQPTESCREKNPADTRASCRRARCKLES